MRGIGPCPSAATVALKLQRRKCSVICFEVRQKVCSYSRQAVYIVQKQYLPSGHIFKCFLYRTEEIRLSCIPLLLQIEREKAGIR